MTAVLSLAPSNFAVSGIGNPTSPTSLLYQPFVRPVSEAVHMSKAQFVERNLTVEPALPEIGVKTKGSIKRHSPLRRPLTLQCSPHPFWRGGKGNRMFMS